VIEAYDNACCWERLWPAILNDLAAAAPPPNVNKPMRPMSLRTGKDMSTEYWQTY
jgi:hypothetical protein